MSHFALLWKARTIEKYRQKYEDEKINSIVLSNANIPEKTLFKRWKHYRNDMKKHLSRTFSKWYPEGTTVSNFVINFGDMKFPHILLRSAVGFLGGLILTYLCFVFFVFQLSISLVNATVLSSFIGILLTLGLTLSNRMRCLVFLLIPQLFSRVGRYTLTCYALVLILTGPATNTLKNSEVLSESMACSQEQIKLSVSQINESVKKPFNSIKDSLHFMIERLKDITWKLKVALVKTNRALITLASIIQSNFFWLDTIAKRCNAELGTPSERCLKSIAKIAENNPKILKAKENDILMELAKGACEYLDFYKKYCIAPDYVEITFLATIKGKLKTFTDRIQSMLFIHIKIQHSYTFIGNSSRTPSQVAAGIVTEIRNRADPIFTWLSWSSCVTSLFLLLIIFRAKHYQHMYETRSRFDNRYITKEFRELDLKRLRENRQTVLPLNRRERAKYVTTTSFRLVASEKVYLNRSAMFMMITTFKLLVHIVADYSLYWVLVTIRYHGSLQTVLRPGIPESGVRVIGQGFVARFLSSLLQTLDIPLQFIVPSHNTCLPKPYPPDFTRYGQIGILILLLWLFALFEPYGLRMRHLIMGHYRPERAKARAVWLYNHILRTRGSFMKFARRKLHREYKYSSYRKMTFRKWLMSLFSQWQRNLLGLKLEEGKCLLCNITKESNDYTQFIKCYGRDCPGTYCESCFSDIGRLCTICISPRDYGDLSDVSLERGSSNEDSDDDMGNDKAGPSIRKNTSSPSPDLEPGPGFVESEMDECNTSIYGTNYRESFDAFPLLRRSMINTNQATFKSNTDEINYPVNNKIDNLNAKGMSDKYLKPNKFIITNKTEKLSQVTKKGLNTTAVFECWYSFYQMNIIGNQLFAVRRVISLNNKIRCRKSASKKLNTVFKGNDKTTKNNDNNSDKNNDKNKEVNKKEKEVTSPSKPEKGDNNCNDNGVKPDEDTKGEKKKKCKKKKDLTDVDIKPTTIRTNYMKYIFSHLIPCTEVTSNTQVKPESNRSPVLPVKEKKKKKRKKSNASPKPLAKAKQSPLESRNYRISSYLADLEWVKNKCENKVVEEEMLKDNTSLNIGVENKPANVDMPLEENESHIKIYDVLIPKLKLNFSNESIQKDEESQTQMKPSPSYLERLRQYVQSNTEYAKVAVDRYFRKMNYSSDSFNISKSSVEVANHNIEDYEVQNNLLSNYNIPRAMKYFDSITKHMDEYRDVTRENVASFDFNSSTEYSDFHRKVSLNTVTSKEIQGNLISNPPGSSDEMSSSGWNRLRRAFSGRLPELGGPLSVMKGLYTSLFFGSDRSDRSGDSSKQRKMRSSKPKMRFVKSCGSEKGVLACPSLCTCGCQKNLPTPNVKNRSAQICHRRKSKPKLKPEVASCVIQVDNVQSTCTCATQYYTENRDVGTYKHFGLPCVNVGTNLNVASMEVGSIETTGTTTDTTFSRRSTVSVSTDSLFNVRSETDTTICSLAQIEYKDSKKNKNRSRGTKANQSTWTEQAKLCDVSTVTDDWWSPIIERKVKIDVPRHNVQRISWKERKARESRTRGMNANGRIVKFRSHAQIIPRESVAVNNDDILSPSRYLLESQKYYNELFSSRFYSPHVLTMADLQNQQKADKISGKGNKRSHYRLNRTTKRLENCTNTPRRMKR